MLVFILNPEKRALQPKVTQNGILAASAHWNLAAYGLRITMNGWSARAASRSIAEPRAPSPNTTKPRCWKTPPRSLLVYIGPKRCDILEGGGSKIRSAAGFTRIFR
ncbi:hypothetical protein SAMN05216312_108237 [Cohnella sp. OV330]|nr:hypothetical protein SAMN05216312_108237 [Cohnella sp. OV330]